MKRVKTIMQELNHEKIDLIKMDIEGSEFDVVEDMCLSGIQFCQLCVEVHDRFFKDGYKRLKKMIKMLNEMGYEIVSISDTKEELTFMKKFD